MAKGKYQQWLEPDGILRIRGWARDGLTDEQIARNMHIGVRTLYEWKNEYPQISQALKEAKDVVDREVENALYGLCMKGNVTAIIFWLKNRKPNEWRDSPKQEDSKALDQAAKLLGGVDSAID